jgi:hypothetical protein
VPSRIWQRLSRAAREAVVAEAESLPLPDDAGRIVVRWADAPSPCLSGASGWSEAVERRPNGDRDGCHDRRTGRSELKDALLDWKPEDVRDHHWKISVVQSPP